MRQWLLRFVATSVGLLVLLAGAISFAGEEDTARKRYSEGSKHYQARRYDKANIAFVQAYALDPKPEYLLGLGQSELRTGKVAKAAQHLFEFLRQNPDASAADRQDAELDLAAAESKVTRATIEVDEAGADILVDGEVVGQSPMKRPIFLAPGARTIAARSEERSDEKEIEAEPNKKVKVALELGGAASPLAATEVKAASGSPAKAEAKASVEAPSNGGRKPFFEWFGSSPIAWVGAGLTVAAGTTAVVFAIASKTHYDKHNRLNEDLAEAAVARGEVTTCDPPPNAEFRAACEDRESARQTADQQRTISLIASAGAGVFLVGTVALYFIDPGARQSSEAAFRWTPVVGPNGGGLAASAVW